MRSIRGSTDRMKLREGDSVRSDDALGGSFTKCLQILP
jgi:hypothetical protein